MTGGVHSERPMQPRHVPATSKQTQALYEGLLMPMSENRAATASSTPRSPRSMGQTGYPPAAARTAAAATATALDARATAGMLRSHNDNLSRLRGPAHGRKRVHHRGLERVQAAMPPATWAPWTTAERRKGLDGMPAKNSFVITPPSSPGSSSSSSSNGIQSPRVAVLATLSQLVSTRPPTDTLATFDPITGKCSGLAVARSQGVRRPVGAYIRVPDLDEPAKTNHVFDGWTTTR